MHKNRVKKLVHEVIHIILSDTSVVNLLHHNSFKITHYYYDMSDEEMITRVYMRNGQRIDIPNEIGTYNIKGGILRITFKRRLRDRAEYFFPLDQLICIAHDDPELLDRITITEDEEIQEVVDRMSNGGLDAE